MLRKLSLKCSIDLIFKKIFVNINGIELVYFNSQIDLKVINKYDCFYFKHFNVNFKIKLNLTPLLRHSILEVSFHVQARLFERRSMHLAHHHTLLLHLAL